MRSAAQPEEAGTVPLALSLGPEAIPRVADRNAAPLSFAQHQIWLHAQLAPDTPIYNEPVTIRRNGSLDVRVLERALTEIVRRHQAWRTTFSVVDGEPVQVIQPVRPVQLRVIDLSQIPTSQRESEARRLAIEDSVRPFDLSQGPLFRCLVVHLSDTEHRLFLTLHHIIFDGYSIYRVLLAELTALYSAFSAGQGSPLPELPIQYPEFARWEREWLSRDSRMSSQLAYWKEQLGGDLSVLQLPTDHPRPAIQSFRGAIQPVSFPRELGDALKELGQREGATLFMTLLAGFALLLHRYSSLYDVMIGTASSGRKRSEIERLLGCFINPLVLRNDLSGDPTFDELLRRTRNTVLEAVSNGDAPFTHVVNEVHPNRSLSFNPLFQVLFTLEPPLSVPNNEWSVALTQPEVDTGISRFDLCLELDDRPSGIVGRFRYSTDLFEADTVARMTGHLTTLLESIVANPKQRVSAFRLLTARERQQVCVDWNETSVEYPSNLVLHEMFTRQVKRTPEAVALAVGDKQMTYAELDRKSTHLAEYLRKQGISSEMPVGLYLEPSCEMIVGTLGVLKAGGACVPMDPSYPSERLAHVVADTQLTMLLTQKHLSSELPRHHAGVLCLDSDWSQVEQQGGEPIRNQSQPDDLAYVIYTSGSTGGPKGVEIAHRNLVHSTHARSIYYGTLSRFLLLSSFAFDSSLAGVLGTLCEGGTLVLTPGPLKSNLTQLAHLVAHHQISHLLCVPTLYSLILEQAKPGQLSSLRMAMVGGEVCSPELVERHYKLLPHTPLFNEYGPTEAAVWSTVYQCQPSQSGNSVPIGRPIPNARTYVLDPHFNPLPVGVPGELYVGGPGVVRGYHNRSGETAKSFIRDPFGGAADSRLYRTGDVARYLPDGNLELLGRFGHQVKIRGFRIELEEIESVIRECEGVRDAVVSFEETGGEPRLVGYVVPSDSTVLDTEKLRRFLSERLPEATVPSAFIKLERLPLMPNGKVNRHSLPAPPRAVRTTQLVPPKDALELGLVEVWRSLFCKADIGATDNFFDLGGNSLLIAKLLLGIEQRFGKKLSLANIFQNPTIRQLAETLRRRNQLLSHPGVVPMQPHGSRPPLFWVDAGPIFLLAANRLGPDQPVLGLCVPASEAVRFRIPGRIEEGAGELVRYLREMQPTGPYYLAGLCISGLVAYEMARQLVSQGQQVALLALFDVPNPNDQDASPNAGAPALPPRSKIEILLEELRHGGIAGLPGFASRRLTAIARQFKLLRWRIQQAIGLEINRNRLLNDPDAIEEPASYFCTPRPYPGLVVFLQSDDWGGPNQAWSQLLSGGCEVHRVSGGHLSMFNEDHVNSVVRGLQDCLARSRSRATA
jgi:surfactin family lipopeptide synthetase A